jgi:Na+/melibiose symporter-like transporter
MISPWKAFAAEVVGLFLMGMACTFVASIWINDENSQLAAAGAMRVAMTVGVVAASVLLSLVGALAFWRLKPLLWAVGVVSAVFGGNPGVVILALLAAIITYYVTNKLRMIVSFYVPDKSSGSDQ